MIYLLGELQSLAPGSTVLAADAGGHPDDNDTQARLLALSSVRISRELAPSPFLVPLAWIHRCSWMNPCCRRGPGSIGGAPAGWTLRKAADRRWAAIGDGGFAVRIGIQAEAPLLGERHHRTSTVAVTNGPA
jgi:hypothetical protein